MDMTSYNMSHCMNLEQLLLEVKEKTKSDFSDIRLDFYGDALWIVFPKEDLLK